jgi:hypothetical protein
MSEEIVLRWDGPHCLRDLFGNDHLKQKFSCPGVYLWIQQYNGHQTLNYVGKASGSPTLYHRQLQHYQYFIGGLYTIPNEFRKCGKDWVPDWNKEEVYSVLLDKSKFLDVVNEAFDCINAYSVHMAKLATAGEAKAIERQLLFDLKPTGTKWGCSTPPAVPIKIVHSNATWATEQIRNHLHGRQIQFT